MEAEHLIPALVAICAGCAEAKIPALVAMAWYLALQFARDVLRQSFRCSGITDRFRAVFLYSESC